MSTEENKALIIRYLDAINGQPKPPALVNQYVDEADMALRQHIADGEVAFPRYELLAEDIIAEGDKVVVRFTWRATHLGDFMGIPPTGHQINVPGMIIYRVAGDKIVEHWMQVDSASLMQQITPPTPVPA